MKRTMADAPAHRRGNAGIAERYLLGGNARLRLLYGGGGDIALHLRGIHVMTADRMVIFQLLIAAQQLLGLAQGSLRAFQFGLRQRQRGFRLGVIQRK